ncbi:MAG: hypothetical protein HQ508_06630, partial [Candidatus Marinimicrobia bacterium]|nr:hypothetical protein [Candidatus Neomarinimicrobiota bacterium]
MTELKHKLMMRFFCLSIMLWLSSCSSNTSTESDLFTFELSPGSNREIAYTDKQDAFWVTRAGGYNNSHWHGLTASKRAYLEDLFISANGELLPRNMAFVSVDPISITREYSDLGIRETWILLDEARTLVIELEAEKATHWTVQPAILGGNKATDFESSHSDQELNTTIKRLVGMPASYPYLKIWFSHPMQWLAPESPEMPLYTAFLTERADNPASHRLTVSVSLSAEPRKVELERGWLEIARSKRQDRIQNRMAETKLSSNDPEKDAAIAWAHNSLDALVMNQQGKGIYAGLPWFDDYWGRDAFISFAGAVLVSGRFEDARQILLSFSELQNIDPGDENYGRVPNRAQPENIIYNTTDGTPWFVRSVWDYYRYTGDIKFLEKMWSSVQHATRGSLDNWVDEDGLLRHADADTWMDAKGPDGPWSPRGDRAIDIQFIWRDQLEITKRLALMFGDVNLADASIITLKKLARGLEKFRAPTGNYLVDHLNVDDSQDKQNRPNVFLIPPLFSETCDWVSFKSLAPQLITRNGVLSLSQNDANFHPYHHQPGLYVQDAAYHNGIVWTWNSAASISTAIRFHQYHYAEALFDNLSHQIMNRGALGTIAELTDAWPRGGKLRLSGTFSQAWSLAEYLRSFYQDILGIRPDLSENRVVIAPRLLGDIKQIEFRHPVGNDIWDLEYEDTESAFDITVQRAETHAIDLSLELRSESNLSHLDLTWGSQTLHLRYEKQMSQWTVPAEIVDYKVSMEAIDIPINDLPFCELDTALEVPSLKGPKHRMLKEIEISGMGKAYTEIANISDAHGDDRGLSGNYVYPSNPQFEPGIADILGFRISKSSQDYRFEMKFANLVDPGWHEEYGYQLTYCVIGFSYHPSTGTPLIGKNARSRFQNNFKADQILYVSGGLLFVDETQAPLAEYMPRRSQGAIGNTKTDMVSFHVPVDVFEGNLENCSFQIAVGCQDDHGGAGIGDFRPVEALG